MTLVDGKHVAIRENDAGAGSELSLRTPGLADAVAAGDARALRRYGIAFWAAGQLHDACTCLSHAVNAAPDLAEVISDLGAITLALGDADRAATLLRRSLQLHARQPQAWISLAHAHRQCARAAEAEDAYRAALMLNPEAVEALSGLGLLLAEANRRTEAVNVLCKARNLGLNDPMLLACLGQLQYQLGDFTAARCTLADAARDLSQKPVMEKYAEAFLVDRARRDPLLPALRDTAEILDNDIEALDRVSRRAFQVLCVYGPQSAASQLADAILMRAPDDPIVAFHRDALAGIAHLHVPPRYLKACFDHFAERFETHLVDVLDYRIPEKAGVLAGSQGRRYSRVLDLGCGTGLAAAHALALGAEHLVGVDISAGMLAVAARRVCYTTLHEAEAVAFLNACNDTFDLVLCLDVLVYFGDLQPLFRALAARAAPGGDVIVSFETGSASPYALAPSGRFMHTLPYLAEVSAPNFVCVQSNATTVRLEANRPVPGCLQLLRRTH